MMSWLLLILMKMAMVAAWSQDLPLCPSGGALLDESYPAKAIVISDVASKGYQADKVAMLNRLLPELLQNPHLKVLFIARKGNFEALTKDLPLDQRQRVLRLQKMPLTNWMQDPWVAQFDNKDGAILLRPLQKYNGTTFDSGRLVGAVKAALEKDTAIRVAGGLELPNKKEALSGQYGGNFLAMGSLCLVGSSNLKDQFNVITKVVCGGAVVKVPTSFLNVGHADEVVKALPLMSKKQKPQGQCPMVLAVGSPRQAKKILEEHPEDLFFDFRDNIQKPLEKKWLFCSSEIVVIIASCAYG